MVEGMSVVVNVMLSLMNVMSPPPDLQPISMHGGEVMYFECVCFRGELGFLNCDDICMCVMNKKFELLEFFIPFMLTCSMMIFLSFLLLGMCSCLMSVVMWLSWYPMWMRWLL